MSLMEWEHPQKTHKTRPTKAQRLLRRLREELDLDIAQDATIVRTYAGYWLKTGGAFSWMIQGRYPELGSQYTVTDLLKCKKLDYETSWGDVEIIPAADPCKPPELGMETR